MIWCEQAKADAKGLAKEEERLRKAVESRDSRLATLVAEKQRLTEDAEQRQREVRRTAAHEGGHMSVSAPAAQVLARRLGSTQC